MMHVVNYLIYNRWSNILSCIILCIVHDIYCMIYVYGYGCTYIKFDKRKNIDSSKPLTDAKVTCINTFNWWRWPLLPFIFFGLKQIPGEWGVQLKLRQNIWCFLFFYFIRTFKCLDYPEPHNWCLLYFYGCFPLTIIFCYFTSSHFLNIFWWKIFQMSLWNSSSKLVLISGYSWNLKTITFGPFKAR